MTALAAAARRGRPGARGGGLAILLDPDADTALRLRCRCPAPGEIVLVVGPEGGISPAEADALAAAGAASAQLGPTVLRASTAGAVAAALLLSRVRPLGVRRASGPDAQCELGRQARRLSRARRRRCSRSRRPARSGERGARGVVSRTRTRRGVFRVARCRR